MFNLVLTVHENTKLPIAVATFSLSFFVQMRIQMTHFGAIALFFAVHVNWSGFM